MTAKLVKTEAVVEGRTEVRWTLVEDDDTPEYRRRERDPPDRRPDAPDHGAARGRPAPRASRSTSPCRGCSRPPCCAARTPTPRSTSLDLDAAAGRSRRALRRSARATGPTNGDAPLSDAPDFAGGAIAAVAADSADAAERGARGARARSSRCSGSSSGIDEAFEKQDFLSRSDRARARRRRRRAGGGRRHGRGRVPRARPAPQLDGAARRRRRLARGRAHRLELDPGHLRRPGDRRRGVRARPRARPRDLRVHGRRVRLEVRRRPAGDPRGRALAPHAAGRCGS